MWRLWLCALPYAFFAAGEPQCSTSGKLEFLPLPSFGAEVRGVNIPDLLRRLHAPSERSAAQEQVRQIHETLHSEFLLAFRGLGKLSWQDQKAFTGLFGEVFNESAHSNRKKHPAIPDHHVGLFSNNPELGNVNVGTEGWHVDGNVVPVPHAITFIHALSAVPGGDTFFVPLREVVQRLREEGFLHGNCVERAPPCLSRVQQNSSAERKHQIPPIDDLLFQSGHVTEISHPMIYPHPVTGYDTMMFGLGKLSGIYKRGCLQPALPATLELTKEDTVAVGEVIEKTIASSGKVLRWRWASGDLLMVDNLALAHLASDGTQASWEEVGVRLMQRTTVKGTNKPHKRPLLHNLPHECVREGHVDDSGGAGHYCVFSLSNWVNYEPGKFHSRDTAREKCRVLAPTADLAIPANLQRNKAMGHIVSTVGMPHWIGGDDYPNGHVKWLDGSDAKERWDPNVSFPWHAPSGQPNDCDGPGSETCMFMGPDSNWFDFACQPKIANKTSGVTPGPEIKWDGHEKRMYDIHILCGLSFTGGEAAQLGLRLSV